MTEEEEAIGVGCGICSLTRAAGVELLIASEGAPVDNTHTGLWLVDHMGRGPTSCCSKVRVELR